MPQALPSDVVQPIDAFSPRAASASPNAQRLVTSANAAGVSALVELVEQLSDETLQLSAGRTATSYGQLPVCDIWYGDSKSASFRLVEAGRFHRLEMKMSKPSFEGS